jgi:GAF domain-containing protein/HAMP domain-containing protein
LQTLALDENLKQTLTENTGTGDLAEIQQLDEQWRNAVSANNTSNRLIRRVLENEISNSLLNFKEKFPAHVEVFVTDVYGANTATTNITSDYYQADEEWWQSAYNAGAGDVYIGQPIFDESSQTLSMQIAVPIFDEQNENIIGILRSTLDLDIFINVLTLGNIGKTGRTEVILPEGFEIALYAGENTEYKLEFEEAHQDLANILNQNQNVMQANHKGEAVFVEQTFLPRSNESPDVSVAITSLNWRVVTLQNREDALQTVANVSLISQLTGLAAVAIASLLAVAMTQYLTRPIARLTQTAEEISSGNYQAQAQVEANDEIGTLAVSFNRMTNQLNETLINLEKRVAERTADLEMARLQSDKRANQLVAVGEISKFVNTEQKMEVLLALITRLVSERFGFYHTGIFLIDETKQFAILQAANSDGGQLMLRRGHKLRIGENSIVSTVAQTGQARIALDVGLDAVYFSNLDLPNTRSEIALPLKLRDNIIGVLDVQSEKPGAFMEDDANTLGILADQIAIAIDNARLFSQTQQTLAEVQDLYRQNLREGWKNFSREEGLIGYNQTLTGGRKLTESIGALEIQQALNRGETMVVPIEKSNESVIVVPIKLRGQVIGAMRIQSPNEEKKWTANEINLSEAVSERLSLALENARLIQESQRQVIKEQTISEITSHIGSSINLENVLRTAVEELGRSIPGSEVIIKLQDENVNGGNA